MTKLLSILIALLTCASALGQSASLQGTGAGNVRGTATAAQSANVSTNLEITGSTIPAVAGTNYVQTTDAYEHHRWYNSDNKFYLYFYDYDYFIATNATGAPTAPYWESQSLDVEGEYIPYPFGGGCSGTATVAYFYITNSPAIPLSVYIRGKVDP